MYRLLLALALLTLPAMAQAQNITHVDFTIFRQATPPVAASATYSIPITSFDCTVPRTATVPTGVVNPRKYIFDDWRNTTTQCEHVEAVGGPLTVLPFDQTTTYYVQGALRSAAGLGPTAQSNSFQRPGSAPTASPANLRVGPSQ